MAPEDHTALDGDVLRRILEMAGGPPENGGTSGTDGTPGAPDLSQLLEAMMDQQGKTESQSEPQSAQPGGDARLSALMAALPQLMEAMNGSADLVKPEKVNLVRAIKPYLPGQQAGSIDRAIRIANITKAAKNALRLLGR